MKLTGLPMCSIVVAAHSGCVAWDEKSGELAESAEGAKKSVAADDLPSGTAREWMSLIMDRVKADVINPPQASRIYAYTGLALYEAALPGMKQRKSLGKSLNDMPKMPNANGPDRVDWPAAQAAAISRVAQDLFAGRSASLAAVSGLRDAQLAARTAAGISPGDIAASIAFGEEIGAAINTWAAADNFAATRGLPFTPPVGPQFWVPTSGAPATTPPAEPYWGTLRPFTLPSHDACAPQPPEPYSEAPSSSFYAQANTVRTTEQSLTDEQKQIALFWADNPGQTANPPGHWIAIVTSLSAASSLTDASELYALIGLAVADAFISCWKTKYAFNLVRPETYIQRIIDPAFTPFIPTPQFPEYPSGHSTSSGSASTLLTGILGNVSFVDTTHVARGFPPREFDTFTQAAEEAAVSRLYGGIHYPMGNNNGLQQGRCVGNFVIDRARTRP